MSIISFVNWVWQESELFNLFLSNKASNNKIEFQTIFKTRSRYSQSKRFSFKFWILQWYYCTILYQHLYTLHNSLHVFPCKIFTPDTLKGVLNSFKMDDGLGTSPYHLKLTILLLFLTYLHWCIFYGLIVHSFCGL